LAIGKVGYINISNDRYMQDVTVKLLGNGDLQVTTGYTRRIGDVETNFQLTGQAPATDAAQEDFWNSLFYTVNEAEEGVVNPTRVPYGESEPPAP